MTTESKEQLTETVILVKRKDGWWLWDETRGMNLAMRAKTKQDALQKMIVYYQRRLLEVEAHLYSLSQKVEAFVEQVREEEY